MASLREGLAAVGSVLAFFVVSCDGESKSSFNDGDGNGGESGDTSGGSSGKGGTVAQGGSSGAAFGGSSGKGGSAGASASAGASTGGASGSAGTGGGRGYRPPDNQLAGCTRLCELEQAAMCPAESTFEKCVEDCHVGIIFEVCSAAWDPLFACVNLAESAECDADGEATVPDCADEMSVAFNCVLTDGITDDFATECPAACVSSTASMCPASDEAACNFQCGILGSAFPVCSTTFGAYAECSVGAEYACDEEGVPEPVGCAETFGAFVDCIAVEYAWQPGRGIVP